MKEQVFKPNNTYPLKLGLSITLIAVLILISGILLMLLISLSAHVNMGIATLVIVASDLVWYLPALALVIPYYNSLRYEILEDEVIVRAGVVTKSVKHVPFRTVTNLTVKRDLLDRLFGIGTLNIQTAGMSGTSGAEESLVGLPNVNEVYEIITAELRRFRGGMSPTTTEVENDPVPVLQADLGAVLVEVRAIRQIMES